MSGDQLTQMLADARALLDAQLEAEQPQPDLADLRARASEGAPLLAPLPDGELAQLPVAEPEPLDPMLAELNADARALLDAMLDTPALPRRALPRSRRLRRSLSIAAGFALFAVASAALANNWLAEPRRAEREALAAAAYSEAARSFEALDPAVPIQLFGAAHIPAQVAPPAPPSPVEAPGTAPSEPARDEPSEPRPARGAKLSELDAEAYAHLRAGELRLARQKFEQLAKIGGRSEYAELAFGELFALARRDPSIELDKLWRAYLMRFPKGRYADAAQAGLCRRARPESEQRCWTDYLEAHPRGSARTEALRALD